MYRRRNFITIFGVLFILSSAIKNIALPISDANWVAVNKDGMGPGGLVTAFVINKDGSVIVGGGFASSGFYYIAKWDGRYWSCLRQDLSSYVNALALDSVGNLYVSVKYFEDEQVRKWDGIKWSILGTFKGEIVQSLITDGKGNLYAGGWFTSVDSVPANNIAKWDGIKWSALGPGTNTLVSARGAPVSALTFDDSGNLYAGGSFTTAGGDSAYSIAKWNGNNWTSLGTGLRSIVRALAFDKTGKLYAGGSFAYFGNDSANYVAQWNGIKWSRVGHLIPYGNDRYNELYNYGIYSLACDKSGNLYAGGTFFCGDQPRSVNIGMWDGTNWCKMGTGTSTGTNGNSVNAIAIDQYNKLYVGGNFTYVNNNKSNCIAIWNGSWDTIIGSQNKGYVSKLVKDNNGNLYVGGSFGHLCGVDGNGNGNNIVKWDGSKWSNLGSVYTGSSPDVNDLALDGSGNLYVGGFGLSVGTGYYKCIVKWDGINWFSIEAPQEAPQSNTTTYIRALAIDGNNNLYAGGDLYLSGNTNAGIGRWDGSKWNTLDSGIIGKVEVLSVDRTGNLYAGGRFTKAGLDSAKCIAKWDGLKWSSLGSGLDTGEVYAIVPDKFGNIYIGGSFTKVGGIPARRIAKWDGRKWDSLGAGATGYVDAIVIDSTGNLFAGGAGFICQWDGSKWTGSVHANKSVSSLAVLKSELFAGGSFARIGDVYSPYLSKANLYNSNSSIKPYSANRLFGNFVQFRLSKSTLAFNNIMSHDHIFIYSLSGRCLESAVGVNKINLDHYVPQPLIVSIRRNNKCISSGMVLLQ